MPIEQFRDNDISEENVVLYVGPQYRFVQYPLRGGTMFNQVAVFESPRALAGEDDWGTPDELDAAFEGTCSQVREGILLMWRDRGGGCSTATRSWLGRRPDRGSGTPRTLRCST